MFSGLKTLGASDALEGSVPDIGGCLSAVATTPTVMLLSLFVTETPL